MQVIGTPGTLLPVALCAPIVVHIILQEVDAKGDSVALVGDHKIVVTNCHSTKVVYLLSTTHGHVEHVVRNRRNGTTCHPEVSVMYNKNMGGVDKQDQLIQPYDCSRKSMKWTKKLFFHSLQMSTCNAFILACKNGYGKPFLHFLEEIIMAWIWQGGPTSTPDEPEDVVRFRDKHFPAPLPPTTKKYPQKACEITTNSHKGNP